MGDEATGQFAERFDGGGKPAECVSVPQRAYLERIVLVNGIAWTIAEMALGWFSPENFSGWDYRVWR